MEKLENTNKLKRGIGKFAISLLTFLAVLNLAVLFFFPDFPAHLMGKDGTADVSVTENAGKGSGKASLAIEKTDLTFDGNGLFNPLAGVTALDNDGSDITRKVSFSYFSGKTISEKEVRYSVYDSENEKLTAVANLLLENYEGPSIKVGEITSVSWEELQRLTEVLVKKGLLLGNDGFGNDVSSTISYSYEMVSDKNAVEITFSLVNQFQDYKSEKITVSVDDIPEDALLND